MKKVIVITKHAYSTQGLLSIRGLSPFFFHKEITNLWRFLLPTTTKKSSNLKNIHNILQ